MTALPSDLAADLMARTDCASCPIRHRAVCARCDDAELAKLETMKSYKSWKAGETIAHEGQSLDFAASVVAGCATLTRSMEDGRTQMVGLLLPSDFIGRPGRRVMPYELVAATDVTLCMFRRAPFEKLLVDMPHVGERLLEMALDELDASREWMLLLGRKTAREKVATLLCMIVRRGYLGLGPARIDLPLGREAMASYLGLTIETVSRQITALRRDGLIVLHGARGVEVPDLAELTAEAGDDADGAPIS